MHKGLQRLKFVNKNVGKYQFLYYYLYNIWWVGHYNDVLNFNSIIYDKWDSEQSLSVYIEYNSLFVFW